MIILSSLNDALLLSLASNAIVSVHASCFDIVNGATLPLRFNKIVGTSEETILVPGPRPSVQREIIFLSVHNDAETNADITLKHDDGTSKVTLWNGILAQKESLLLDKQSSWALYRSNGTPKYS